MSEERQSAPDPLLLRWQEDELYEAEKKVLRSFRENQLGKFVVPPEGSSAPEKPADDHTAEDWQGAVLRADFLRDLFLERYEGVEPLPLVISRAWVEGILQLSYREIRLPLLFSHCVFSSPMFLWGATIPELQLSGCDLREGLSGLSAKVLNHVSLNKGFKAGGEVYLHSAGIGGHLICSGGHFRKDLNASNLKTSSHVFLDDGFKADGEVYLHSAEIGGELNCSGGHFEKGLTAFGSKANAMKFRYIHEQIQQDQDQELSTMGIAKEFEFVSKSRVCLENAEISTDLDFDSPDENGNSYDLAADNLRVGGNVLLQSQYKKVCLKNARIQGDLSCRGGSFEKDLDARNLKVDGDVRLDGLEGEGEFRACGNVNLSGAEIGRELRCAGGEFCGGLNARYLKVSSHVILGEVSSHGIRGHYQGIISIVEHRSGAKEVTKTVRSVDLSGAEIGGNLDLSHASVFPMKKDMGYSYTKGVSSGLSDFMEAVNDAMRNHREPDPDRDMPLPINHDEYVQDDGDAESSAAESKAIDEAPLDPSNAEVKGEFRVGRNIPECSAEDFRYRRIKFVEQDGTEDGDWEKGLEWLKKAGDHFESYMQLMAAYRRMGHSNWARNIGFSLEKKRSEEFKKELKHLPWRAWYGILRWTIGYGYRPFASFLWAAGLLMAGSLLFSSGHKGVVSEYLPSGQALVNEWLPNEWIPSDGEALASPNWQENREPSPDYLPFNPVIYSLESTFPVLNLGQLDKWHPSNPFLLGVRWAWTLIGTLLLAILALFGAGVLGPRTQSGDDGG